MQNTRKTLLWLTGPLLFAGTLAYWWQAPNETVASQAPDSAQMFGFVRSLEGTRPDGDLKVNAHDKLVVDAELGRMFDYYLSALGEKSLDAIQAEAEAELMRKLSPAAAQQARRLLTKYLDYKRALVDVEKNLVNAEKNQKLSGSTAAILRARLNAMQETRKRFFTAEEAQGLFGFQDSYDLDAVARLEVEEDQTLSARQKQEKMAAIDANMPAALREEREAPLRVAKAENTVQQMRANGASEQDIYQFRAKTFSPEAAARLAEVDQEEAAWKARIAAYLQQRQQIQALSTSEEHKLTALQALRQQHFSAEEQGRLVAYE